MGSSFFSFRKGPLGAGLPATPSQRKKKKRTSMMILQLLLARRSAATTEFSGAELARLKKRTYYERQRTRWWFRNRFRNLLQCTSSTIFYENVSLGSSGSGSGSRPRTKKQPFLSFFFSLSVRLKRATSSPPWPPRACRLRTWRRGWPPSSPPPPPPRRPGCRAQMIFFSLFFFFFFSLSLSRLSSAELPA